MINPLAIVAAVRTPLGVDGGPLSGLSRVELGAVALKAAVGRARLRAEQVQALILEGGLSDELECAQDLIRAAGLPPGIDCLTLKKARGPDLALIQRAMENLQTHPKQIILVGGWRGRPFRSGVANGFAEKVFDEDVACVSHDRVRQAIQAGAIAWEVVPVPVAGGTLVGTDCLPESAEEAASPGLAVLALAREETARALGLRPLAFLRGEPSALAVSATLEMAIKALLGALGWRLTDVDAWALDNRGPALALPPDRVNPHGGPGGLGASGIGMLVTLLGALRRNGWRQGIAATGGGPEGASALALELTSGVACGGR